MFSALRQGTPFYILNKENEPTLPVGQVESVSPVRPKYQSYTTNPMGMGVETVVDINVNIDGKTMEFKQIPSNLSVANFGSSGVVISESQEAMASEVNNLIIQNKKILDNIDYYKKAVSSYEQMLRQLNPQYAKEKQVDDTLNSLTNDVASMKNDLSKIIGILGQKQGI